LSDLEPAEGKYGPLEGRDHGAKSQNRLYAAIPVEEQKGLRGEKNGGSWGKKIPISKPARGAHPQSSPTCSQNGEKDSSLKGETAGKEAGLKGIAHNLSLGYIAPEGH